MILYIAIAAWLAIGAFGSYWGETALNERYQYSSTTADIVGLSLLALSGPINLLCVCIIVQPWKH